MRVSLLAFALTLSGHIPVWLFIIIMVMSVVKWIFAAISAMAS